MELYDGDTELFQNNQFIINMNSSDILIPGSEFSDNRLYKDLCFLGFQKGPRSDRYNDTWTLGYKIMQKYYLVFDQDNEEQVTNRMGIALKNPQAGQAIIE